MQEYDEGAHDRHRTPAAVSSQSQPLTTSAAISSTATADLCRSIQSSPRCVSQRQELSRTFGTETRPSPTRIEQSAAQGLPPPLRSGIETLSGLAMDQVQVHYNSTQPAALGALAYAQGSDIHLAPGQEQHLPHEAWHVVQQAQGRVQPTLNLNAGVPVNDDAGLEREADMMGAEALLQAKAGSAAMPPPWETGRHDRPSSLASRASPLQMITGTMRDRHTVDGQELRAGDVIEYEFEGKQGLVITEVNGEKLPKPVRISFGRETFLSRLEKSDKSPSEGKQVGKLGAATVKSSPESPRPSSEAAPNGMRVGDRCVSSKLKSPKGGFWVVDGMTGKGDTTRLLLKDPDGESQPQDASYLFCSAPSERKALRNQQDQEDGTNKLVRDRDASDKDDQIIRKTPTGLKSQVDTRDGKKVDTASYAHVDWDETANMTVNYALDEGGLTLDIEVFCNPAYMCKTQGDIRDLVPIYIERANDKFIDFMAVLEPTLEGNHARLKAAYSWPCLGTMLKLSDLDSKPPKAIWEELGRRFPTLGVKAHWLAALGGKNSPNHSMGGVLQKGGSGLIKLRTLTLEDYLATEEHDRNTEWNEGEKMHRDRPVFKRFEHLLKLGEEMATTLEAESEYVVDSEKTLMKIVEAMKKLLLNKSAQQDCAILDMEGKSEPKIYTDTYYDIVGTQGKAKDNALLKSGVVMRHRSVVGDKEGLFLFSIKGRSVKLSEKEVIRLAAQIKLQPDAMKHMKSFLSDREADNPFARVFQDALNNNKVDLSPEQEPDWDIAPVLKVHSRRYKFLMKLADSTAIDFSADIATGYVKEMDDKSPKVCSFEFGVGHPGVNATATASSTGGKSVEAQETGRIHRPYHVPQDLDNKELFAKSDYQQYQALRDTVMDKILSAGSLKLERGGNKASLLAHALGLI